MKTKIVLIMSLLFLVLACTDENPIENEVTTDLQSILETIDQEDDGVYPITKEEMQKLQEEHNQDRSLSSRGCQRETIIIYWNGATETDFALRQQWREEFMNNHGLDGFIGAFPESVEVDSEFWIFYDEDGHPCHTQGVMQTVDNNGDDEVSTRDD